MPFIEQLRAEPGWREPPPGAAATRGQQLHEVAEHMLHGMPIEGGLPEERRIVNTYVDHVNELMGMIVDSNSSVEAHAFFIEERFDTEHEECWGTVDTVLVSYTTKEMWIIDLKTGHQRVDAQENTQLLIYALGVLRRLQRGPEYGFALADWRIHLHIVQPTDAERPLDAWSTTGEYLVVFRDALMHAIHHADQPETPFVAGDHCTYCPAAARCPTLASRTTSVFLEEGHNVPENQLALADGRDASPVPLRIESLTQQQVAFFLQHRGAIRDFLAAVETRARANPPPGWKVVAGQARRAWTDPEAVVQQLEAAGLANLIRRQPPTITDARRELGDRNPIVATYAVPREGNPVIVPESDRRPALDPARAFEVEHLDGGSTAPG